MITKSGNNCRWLPLAWRIELTEPACATSRPGGWTGGEQVRDVHGAQPPRQTLPTALVSTYLPAGHHSLRRKMRRVAWRALGRCLLIRSTAVQAIVLLPKYSGSVLIEYTRRSH